MAVELAPLGILFEPQNQLVGHLVTLDRCAPLAHVVCLIEHLI